MAPTRKEQAVVRAEPHRQLRERSALTAVLLGQTGVPHGETPSAAEMREWAAQRLSGVRLAEVESHIAHDPAVFERAMAALRAHAQAPRETWLARAREALSAWSMRPLPAFAAGLAALAAVALFLTQWQGSSDALPGAGVAHPPVLRGGGEAPADWRLAAFRAGYLEAQAAAAADRAATDSPPQNCVDGSGCAEQAQQLVRFGKLLATLIAACQDAPHPQEREALAQQLKQVEEDMAPSLELLPWRAYARELAADLAPGGADACARADALRLLLIAH
jgi:hypothetical protein